MVTAISSDPTAEFLERFADPEAWVIVPNVPIFAPHTRQDPAGNPLFTVGPAELERIRANHDWLRTYKRVVPTITLGHRIQDKRARETDQPDIVGYALNYRVATFADGQPHEFADFYYLPDRWEEARQYPFRSPEYYQGNPCITSIALLKRDPELDLGMIAYSSPDALAVFDQPADEPFYCYARNAYAQHYAEASMPDPTMPPSTNPAAPPAAPPAKPVMQDDPVWQYMCQQYQKFMGAQAPAPGPAAAPPVMPHPTMPPHQPAAQLARDVAAIQYGAQEARLRELEARVSREECTGYVKQLAYEGYALNAESEVLRLMTLDGPGRLARMAEIRQFHQKDPTHYQSPSGFLPIIGPGVESNQAGEFTERHLTKAHEYLKQHPGADWEDAKAYAMAPTK